MIRTAAFQERVADEAVRCCLCPHGCVLQEGKDGLCRVRGVREGELKALAYGLISSAHIDPIEKKPLYHFHPGKQILSIGGWGCNLRCAFCQNWSISQEDCPDGTGQEPTDIVSAAQRRGSMGIAYTYNEPLISLEFVMECARAAHDAGIANVLVTNGFITTGAGRALIENVDALNIDIKSMEESFYAEHCGGRLQPVLDFAVLAAGEGKHVEITSLLIPGLNDSRPQLRELASWIRENLGPLTPLHLSAYHPQYKMMVPATSAESMLDAWKRCREQLSYVYVGNVRADTGQNTLCPDCGALLVERHGYSTSLHDIEAGNCSACGRAIDIVGL